jgi:hypothetical protein
VVFPSLNGALTQNVAAVTWMRGRALGADYTFSDSAGSGSAAQGSVVMTSDGWGGGLGLLQQSGTGSSVTTAHAGLAGRLDRFGLGIMASSVVSPSSGSASFSYAGSYAGSGGFRYAAILDPGVDTVTLGTGWVDSGVFGIEGDVVAGTGSLGGTSGSLGVRLDGEYFGTALKVSTILSSPFGATTGTLNFSGGVYVRLGSKYAVTAEKDGSVYTAGLNIAL